MSASGNAKSRMERILRLHEQIDEIKRDIREIYAEEKSDGGDKTAMGNAISIIRKRAKDKDAFDEREALTDVYLNAYQAPSRAHAPARTRKGDGYADAKLVETVAKGVQTETGRKALATAIDAMIEREEIDPETGEILESGSAPHSASSNEPAESSSDAISAEIHESPSNRDVSADGEASPLAGPQAEASPSREQETGTLAGHEGRSEGEAASAGLPANSNPQASSSRQADKAETAPPPVVSANIHEPDATTSRPEPAVSPAGHIDTPAIGQASAQTDGGAIGEVKGAARLPDADSVEPSPSEPLFTNPKCLKPKTCPSVHSRTACFDCVMAWAERPKDEQVRLWQEAIGAAA